MYHTHMYTVLLTLDYIILYRIFYSVRHHELSLREPRPVQTTGDATAPFPQTAAAAATAPFEM